MMREDTTLLDDFLAESHDHLAGIEADLLAIEDAGADIDEALVNKVFRAAHSIKGGAGFLDLKRIQELAHKAETVLAMIRGREIVPNPEVVNVLLQAFDRLRDLLRDPIASNTADISAQAETLTGLAASHHLPEAERAALSRQVAVPHPQRPASIAVPEATFARARRMGEFVFFIEYDLLRDVERRGQTPLDVIRLLGERGDVLDAAIHPDVVGTLDGPPSDHLPLEVLWATAFPPEEAAQRLDLAPERLTTVFDPWTNTSRPLPSLSLPPDTPVVGDARDAEFVAADAPDAAPVVLAPTRPVAEVAPSWSPPPAAPPALATPAGPRATESSGAGPTGETTLRVNVSLLETLMDLAGELVLARNQLREALAGGDGRAVGASSQRVNLVTSEMQEAIMQTRMQPIGNVFGKFPRVVRDLARTLGKDVQLLVEGKDVGMDKTLVEGLADPLTHMVRNAVDHAIEPAEERLRLGKPPVGTITLRACHEAGQVVVEVADDGRGIDPARIAESALAKGLVAAEQLRGMADRDKLALVFLPGLSTAKRVTDVSGRGVGMDVVKTNLDRLGGKIEIQSELGAGTLFRIKLPLTLAIIPSLLVSVGAERFAIPQVNVVELLLIPAADVRRRIEVVGDAEVLLLRGALIPIVRLSELLGIGRDGPAPTGALQVVVLSSGTLRYALVVDALHNTEEIVVKPLGRHLKGLGEYAGATLMGDGRVALILDAAGLATKAQLASVAAAAHAGEHEESGGRERAADVLSLVFFQNAPGETCAMPLDLVRRVERIDHHRIETVGGRRTMQYRGASLPLATLADVAPVGFIDTTQAPAVLVTEVAGREVGLLGAMPVDIVEVPVTVDRETLRAPGLAGSFVYRDRTVLLVDVLELVHALHPEWAAEAPAAVAGATTDAGEPLVLVAEDSDFFRAQVRRFLEADGYRVVEAPDGEAAWELLDQYAGRVQALVTDIEMPRLSGLGLASRLRADGRFATLPVIGLSSLAGEDDVARGRAAGMDDYQVKLDRDRLVDSIRTFLAAAPAVGASGVPGF